jgi:hypothetical protein
VENRPGPGWVPFSLAFVLPGLRVKKVRGQVWHSSLQWLVGSMYTSLVWAPSPEERFQRGLWIARSRPEVRPARMKTRQRSGTHSTAYSNSQGPVAS